MTEVRIGKMKWEMIFWIAVTLIFRVNGQDVSFQYDGCYSDGITMTAKYTGSGTVSAVQWYYSGKTGNNLFITPGTCSVAGLIPPGYPTSDQMEFQCPSTHPDLEPNTFKLTVTGLEGEDLKNSWGATFSLSTASSPDVVNASFSVCATTTSDCGLKVFHNCEVPDEGGVVAWVFISIAIAALVTIAIILILKFVFDVKFPCRILNCENMRTSPNCTDPGSKTEKTGKPQQPKDEENQDLTKTSTD